MKIIQYAYESTKCGSEGTSAAADEDEEAWAMTVSVPAVAVLLLLVGFIAPEPLKRGFAFLQRL